MKFKLALISILIPLIFIQPITGDVKLNSQKKDTKQSLNIESKKVDKKAQVLAAYLAKHNSPLQYHSQDFIEAADKYNLNWKLVVAIAGVESTFGKQIPGGYNAYGWAIYTPDSQFAFNSWRDGIFTVSEGLKVKYVDRGLETPLEMNRVYAASPTWGAKVNYFLNDMESFEKLYNAQADQDRPLTFTKLEAKTAGSSASLASNI